MGVMSTISIKLFRSQKSCLQGVFFSEVFFLKRKRNILTAYHKSVTKLPDGKASSFHSNESENLSYSHKFVVGKL